MVWGALIGAAGSIAGSAIGASASSASNAANAEIMERQLAFQRELAQNGVRWKVADAQAAGIHPIFALGAPPFNPSPVAIANQPDMSWANGLADASQNIGRAVDASRTTEQKVDARVAQLQELQLEGARLDNLNKKADYDFRIAQTASMFKDQIGPPWPDPDVRPYSGFPPSVGGTSSVDPWGVRRGAIIPGQSGSLVVDSPLERIGRGGPGEPGTVADIGYLRTPTGWSVAKSKDSQERLEDDFIGTLAHAFRNRIQPMLGVNRIPPDVPLPPGYEWVFDWDNQEYRQVPRDWFKRSWRDRFNW